MPRGWPTESIMVRAAKNMVSEIDALAASMDRSRNDLVVQALEQYLQTNAWQMEKIREGLAAAREGSVVVADEVFSGIAAKHGWAR
ncbi:MAG: hypothetical protein CGW95_06990 [Phenylobacterium zucineum]|nr:MAG: hypothetical protein CGW95_06990 [Phenylobacterium zucineum]